ncbi:MAG: hypothetical protein RBS51_05270 [Anaerovoracaceae bacterium]|nr:hypothetical protein [Anaerovoracaceae bacterium]
MQVGVAIKTQDELNELLTEVIDQAQALGIPLSSNINRDVVVNQRARSRFGCCKIIHPSSSKNSNTKQSESLDKEHKKNPDKNQSKNTDEIQKECPSTKQSQSSAKNQNETRYIIEISKALAEAPVESIREVLAHEVLHTSPGGDRHTGPWKKYASMMNQSYGYHIKRTNSPESLGVDQRRKKPTTKYLIVCKKCGMSQERSRVSRVIKHPSLYRCKCGGKLSIKRA